jgi:FkbM family methyltransferase
MLNKLLLIIYKVIIGIDNFFKIIFKKKSVVLHFVEFVNKISYKEKKIENTKVKFFCPNNLIEWRVNTFYTKEPETLDWIKNFNSSEGEIVFWDIGANIGLYSIFAALKYENIKIIAFEPSTSNLRILSRNISKNNLSDKINICQLALTSSQNKFLNLNESNFLEGSALHSFGEEFGHDGEKVKFEHKYSILGSNMDFLIKNKIIQQPNYIKMDVDGIEHFILSGGEETLKSKNLKSISIELNENFTEQYDKSFEILTNANFKFIEKNRTNLINVSDDYKKTYNFIFEK